MEYTDGQMAKYTKVCGMKDNKLYLNLYFVAWRRKVYLSKSRGKIYII